MDSAAKTLRSFGEVGFYVARAAIGAGVPIGLADDAVIAAVGLARMGHDPTPVFVRMLDALDSGESTGAIMPDGQVGVVTLGGVGGGAMSALFAVPGALDWLSADDRVKEVRLINIDAPAWLMAACWATSHGDKVVRAYRQGSTGAWCEIDADCVAPATCKIARQQLAGDAPCGQQFKTAATGVAVDSTAWASVLSYFGRCLVPSDEEQRRAGAGAGLVDTD